MEYIADLKSTTSFHNLILYTLTTTVTLVRVTILKKKKVLQPCPDWLEGSALIRIKFHICELEGSTVTCLYCIMNGICIHWGLSVFLLFWFFYLCCSPCTLYLFESCICVALYFCLFDICICVTLYFYPFDICICVALLWKSSSRHALEGQEAHLWHACT